MTRSSLHMNITPTRRSQRNLEKISKKFPERIPEGMKLATLEMAYILRAYVRARAPQIEGVDYAKDLEVVSVTGGNIGAAVIYTNEKGTLDSAADDKIVYIGTRGNSAPEWVFALKKYQPWPANMIPAELPDSVRLVTRTVGKGEVSRLKDRILSNSSRIERDVRNANGPPIRIGDSVQSDAETYEDLGFLVLRTEFGYGRPGVSHWRPAVVEALKQINDVAKKFEKYIMTGNPGVFTAQSDGDMGFGQLVKYGGDFENKIGAAAGLNGYFSKLFE